MTDRTQLVRLLNTIFDHNFHPAVVDLVNTEVLADHLLANGVRLESKQATSDENKRWIAVTERLPEDDRQVLACTKKGKAFSAHYDHRWKSWSVSHTVKITHWMHMPEPPTEKGGAE